MSYIFFIYFLAKYYEDCAYMIARTRCSQWGSGVGCGRRLNVLSSEWLWGGVVIESRFPPRRGYLLSSPAVLARDASSSCCTDTSFMAETLDFLNSIYTQAEREKDGGRSRYTEIKCLRCLSSSSSSLSFCPSICQSRALQGSLLA